MIAIKRDTVFIILIVVVLFTSCAKTPIYKSSWQDTTETVDGFVNIDSKKVYYDSNAKMVCWLSNDENTLLVNLKVVDITTQKKIMVTGLTLWVDTVGKKDQTYGLTYPIKTTFRKPMSGEAKPNQQHNIKLTGFNKYEEDYVTSNKTTGGINVVFRLDSLGIMYYEAGIPLNMLFSNPKEYLTDSTKVFSVGFETGSLEIPVAPSSGGSMGGGMSKGGGGSRGGAGGAGGSGGGRGSGGSANMSQKSAEMQAMAQVSKFWIKSVRLSNSEK